MSSLSPERRNRQKHKQKFESYPEEDYEYFQICVNIMEAKKLAWSNPQAYNSYVVVILGKEKHRTTVKKNMQEPCFREYFIFEWYATLKELQSGHLSIAVMEPRCCTLPRLLGEANIDLGAVWNQPNHQIVHKWAQLHLPRELEAGTVGFLKLDISIVCRDEISKSVQYAGDICKSGQVSPHSDLQTANYLITVYAAYSLPLGSRVQGERCYGKPPNSYVKVSFCGLSAKTAVQYRNINPVYYEQISMVEIFPNSCPLVRFEVCSSDLTFNKTLASADLKLADVSYDGENGFVPTFGPSLLHMYGNNCQNAFCNSDDGPHYKGALLVSLKTIVPYKQQQLRSINVEPVSPIQLNNLWKCENFCIYCPILEVSMLDRHVTGKVSGVAISIGEMAFFTEQDQEFTSLVNHIKTKILHHTGSLEVVKTGNDFGYLDFSAAFPVLQLGVSLPDFRSRIYRNNLINYIIKDLEKILIKLEQKIKTSQISQISDIMDQFTRTLDETAGNILKFLDYAHNLSPKYERSDCQRVLQTDLDLKQTCLQKEEMEKLYKQIYKKIRSGSLNSFKYSDTGCCDIKKQIKILIAETKVIVKKLKSIVFKSSEGWPDIVIWLLHGSTRVAYYKIPPSDIIHALTPEQSGKFCGRIQTVYVKPIKCHKHLNSLLTSCYCITGKIELIMWMGEYKEKRLFVDYIPKGYKLKTKDYDMCLKSVSPPSMIECRAFIYQAKISQEAEISAPLSTFVRVSALNTVAETKVQQNIQSPTWNQVLRMCTLALTTISRIVSSPPTMLVEVYEKDLAGKCELVGRTEVKPVVDERKDIQYAPKLQWHTLYRGDQVIGQILMSAQLLQIQETVVKSTLYGSVEGIYEKDTKDGNNQLTGGNMNLQQTYEEIPYNLIPKSTKYKMDVYWWGLRDVEVTRKPCAVLEIDEVTIKSEIISDKKKNSNFPNGRVSQIFEAPLNEVYCPCLNIRLYDSNTFGRTLFLGTNVVKNPKKYVVNWIPKVIREDSLKSNSISSAQFIRVTDSLFIKKSETASVVNKFATNNNSLENIASKKQPKKHSWKRLFCQKEIDEEEYFLLPIYKNEKQIEETKVSKTKSDNQDWWLRFFASQKNITNENIEVVESEKIKIYESELENQPEFSKFKDWCKTLKLYNGSKTGLPEEDEKLRCGYLKAGIAIYEWPPPPDIVAVSVNGVELDKGYFDDHPNNDPHNFLVRVYIVRGVNLMPKDFIGKSDPYVLVKCGSKMSGDRNQFIPHSVNPVFGKMHEFRCTLPEDYLLTISLYDHSNVTSDEFIGSTTIDLENRIYTKHRARVGLATEYNVTGPGKWRDCLKPSSILEEVCSSNHMPSPVFPDNNTVLVNGVEYKEEDSNKPFCSASERKENLCLMILQKWHTLSKFGYHLVPEHVETRRLMNPDKPGISQGKIQMWVDIFPLDTGLFIPLPVNITPRKVEDYELRVIIWSVQNVGLKKLAHKKGVDIYAKAWIGHVEQAQYTDIHYHSTYGEGCFNWRMIFNFAYLHAENKLVRKDKGPFTESEERIPPIFVIQIIDNDATNGDDCLASLMLDLNSLPLGSKSGKYCAVDLQEISKKINLFSITTIRGWWPLKHIDRNTGLSTFAGLIDLELTLIPKEKALIMPVGMGREPPFPLPEPRIEPCPHTSSYSTGLEKAAEFLIIIVTVITIIFAVYYWKFPDVLLGFMR